MDDKENITITFAFDVAAALLNCRDSPETWLVRVISLAEAVVVALLGHTPNSISMSYGAAPWSELRRAVKLL